MIKEKALQNVKANMKFLQENPEWNNDKEIVMTAVQQNGRALEYASNALKNDKEIVMAAVKKNGWALYSASDELKNDKDVVLTAIQQNGYAFAYASDNLRQDKEIILIAIKQGPLVCRRSLLKGYQTFDEIVEKEGETFLFSCWNNDDYEIRLRVANHHNFLPTIDQIEIGLKDYDIVKTVYELRKDEWLAKIEEKKLENTFL